MIDIRPAPTLAELILEAHQRFRATATPEQLAKYEPTLQAVEEKFCIPWGKP